MHTEGSANLQSEYNFPPYPCTVFCVTSSSFYGASVANVANVLQPYWLIVLHLDVPDLTASLLLWCPSGQRWRCLWTFLFSNVLTFATSRLQEILAAQVGTTLARNGRWILPENARLPGNIQGSFTCRKSTTWDRRLYFPSEGRRAEDFFFALKNPTASVGFEPANLGTKGQHATSRPPKPLLFHLFSPFCLPMGLFSPSNAHHSGQRAQSAPPYIRRLTSAFTIWRRIYFVPKSHSIFTVI